MRHALSVTLTALLAAAMSMAATLEQAWPSGVDRHAQTFLLTEARRLDVGKIVMSTGAIQLAEFMDRADRDGDNYLIIDLSSEEEFRNGHIAFAENWPLPDNDNEAREVRARVVGRVLHGISPWIPPNVEKRLLMKPKTIIVHCKTGTMRSPYFAPAIAYYIRLVQNRRDDVKVALLAGGYIEFEEKAKKYNRVVAGSSLNRRSFGRKTAGQILR